MSVENKIDFQSSIIRKTREFVRKRLLPDPTGHDFHHSVRVATLALKIAGEEDNPDRFIIELASLLHDIADWKFHEGDDSLGVELSKHWLIKNKVTPEVIESVIDILKNISFRGAGVENKIKSLEGRIVQDADRLDALGAIGIARTFAYGGYMGSLIYDPELKPVFHENFEQYKKSRGTSINHFHEKLLLLKDRMNTDTGRKIAAERHRFMKVFLERFLMEWECEGLE
ncbi:MAG: HD domain-containing protein [Candidatus Wallbacteria bacterium]|nr:HD domain-containing protein [Candidatus Wallbacteria bacterium]